MNRAGEIREARRPDHLIDYWKGQAGLLTLVLASGLSFNTMTVLVPAAQGAMIDALANQETGTELVRAVLMFSVLVAVSQGLRYLKRMTIRRFANRTSAAMRLSLFHNLMARTDPPEQSAGDLLNRGMLDVDLCVEGMRKFTTELFDTGVLMVSYLIVMLGYDLKLTLTSCLFIPLAMVLAALLKKQVVLRTSQTRSQTSVVSSMTLDFCTHAVLYRISGVDELNRRRYQQELASLRKKAAVSQWLGQAMQPLYNSIAMGGILLVILGGAQLFRAGQWTLGSFTAYMTMFTALALKASKASKLFNAVQQSSVSWKRIRPLLTPPAPEIPAQLPQAFPAQPLILKAQHLSPAFDGGTELFHDLSMEFKEGQIIGVTGPVACGKSTLGRMLAGQDPYAGSLNVNGVELSRLSSEQKAKLVAVQEHQPQLFSGTLEENIRFDDPDSVNEVLRQVCFEEDLTAVGGVRALAGEEGSRLSGGQQARIALARALISPARILILDDPLSAVDVRTEAEIMKTLVQQKQRLIFLISHRIHHFDQMDQVLYLDGHGQTRLSTHDQLMEEVPAYRELVRLQRRELSHEAH